MTSPYWSTGTVADAPSAATCRAVWSATTTTGLIRGLLCSSCNSAEARTASLLFDNYRRQPPAAILAVEVLDLPAGFRPGTRHVLPAAM
jgi:hypothetical protein